MLKASNVLLGIISIFLFSSCCNCDEPVATAQTNKSSSKSTTEEFTGDHDPLIFGVYVIDFNPIGDLIELNNDGTWRFITADGRVLGKGTFLSSSSNNKAEKPSNANSWKIKLKAVNNTIGIENLNDLQIHYSNINDNPKARTFRYNLKLIIEGKTYFFFK